MPKFINNRKQVLSKWYYRDYLLETLKTVKKHYSQDFSSITLGLLKRFESLDKNSQCLVIRMLGRKKHFYRSQDLRYEELSDSEDIIERCLKARVLSPLKTNQLPYFFEHANKQELFNFCSVNQTTFRANWDKKTLLAKCYDVFHGRDAIAPTHYVQVRDSAEFEFLLFLFFGSSSSTLAQFTLKDLGVLKTRAEMHQAQSRRFEDLGTAWKEYFFHRSKAMVAAYSEHFVDWWAKEHPVASWPRPSSEWAEEKRNELITKLATSFATNDERALSLLKQASGPPARLLYAKLLAKKDPQKIEPVLEQIIDSAWHDEEHSEAVELYNRLTGKQKVSELTLELKNCPSVSIDEAHRGQAESGILSHFRSQGAECYFCENKGWLLLFILCFWDYLEGSEAQFHSEFDAWPHSLKRKTFTKQHDLTEQKIQAILEQKNFLEDSLEKLKTHPKFRASLGHSWAPSLRLLMQLPADALAAVLIRIANDFEQWRSGFPDLILKDREGIRLLEVKAPGDKIRRKQWAQIQFLKRLGVRCGVIRAHYSYNPSQIYVVVDLETTGGSAQYHRVTEVAAIKTQNSSVVDSFHSLINPLRPIPANISRLTGITNEMVKQAPTFQSIADELFEFCSGSLFVAHNARFDYQFLQREFARVGLEFKVPTLCTRRLSKQLFPGLGSYGLAPLCDHFKIPLENHHRAMDDAMAAASLLNKINEVRTVNCQAM